MKVGYSKKQTSISEDDLKTYYEARAKEYDKVYLIPEEQEDLAKAAKIVHELFVQKKILEIACGTGYWTEVIAKSSVSVMATDINESVIEIAKARNSGSKTNFKVADMYDLSFEEKFDALFGGFIWSHILLQDLDKFLNKMKSLLEANALMVFIDSKPIPGTSHSPERITYTDDYGNTYQERRLEDNTIHNVLKNFPSREFLMHKLSSIAEKLEYIDLEHYWIGACTLKTVTLRKSSGV